MKKELLIKNIWDTILIIVRKVIVWIGLCFSAHQTIVGFFEPIINRFSKFINYDIITKIIYEVFVVGIIYVIILSIYEVTKKEIIIKLKTDKKIKLILKIGSYQDNMKEVINRAKKEKKDAIFIIGVNDEISMSKAERRGVHKAVLDEFYKDEEKCNELQERVNKAFNKNDSFKGNFGDIGIVTHDEYSKFLFIINSKFEEGRSTSIVGPQPSDLIRSAFKELESQSSEIVQIPVISSRNVRCTENNKIKFSVTIAEIVTQYFQQVINNNNIDYDLVISLRKEDLEENLIGINEIVRFINNLKAMYHIR